MPKKANYDYTHTLRMSRRMLEFLKQEAQARGIKVPELIRHVLSEFMKAEEEKRKEVKHEKRET